MADSTPLRTSTIEAEFNAFLVEIADQITKEEVNEMKFLCLGTLGEINIYREEDLMRSRNHESS